MRPHRALLLLLLALLAAIATGCTTTSETAPSPDATTAPDDLSSTLDVTDDLPPDASAEDAARDLPDLADDTGVDPGDSSVSEDAVELADVSDASDTTEPPPPPPPPEPLRILFIGNSFTLGGPVPTIVDQLANDAGWPDPHVEMRAVGGETLEGHRGREATLAAIDEGDWDVVVLQEYSTRPTDALGNPARFKTDATWFHDRIKATSPGARVVLYETWARHPDHSYYPTRFADAAEMQAQLRFHYQDAATVAIPQGATQPVVPPVEVAPAGDAWERHLSQPDALRLHASDDYHAARTGQYLSALVLYATIYDRRVEGLTPWQLSGAEAALLQRDADATTGRTTPGGPSGQAPPLGLEPGERILVDLGNEATQDAQWNVLSDPTGGQLINARTTAGGRSTVDLVVTRDFGGVNGVGLANNTLGYPASASRDSFFCGSFDDHAQGLQRPAAVTLRGLDPQGRYTVRAFASRAGSDGSLGRLTRYAIGDEVQDVDVADNAGRQAVFTGLAPSATGELVLDVAVSPAGGARFCYLGVVEVEREQP